MSQNTESKNRRPTSLLIVCEGNTCRSPMAEALARRNWPDCIVKSVGIKVPPGNTRAAPQAIATMSAHGLNIENHKPTPITEVVIDQFEFVLALCKPAHKVLVTDYHVSESKIVKLYVKDPFDDNDGQYVHCANKLARGLKELFSTESH